MGTQPKHGPLTLRQKQVRVKPQAFHGIVSAQVAHLLSKKQPFFGEEDRHADKLGKLFGGQRSLLGHRL